MQNASWRCGHIGGADANCPQSNEQGRALQKAGAQQGAEANGSDRICREDATSFGEDVRLFGL
jgi:hypothetical protein